MNQAVKLRDDKLLIIGQLVSRNRDSVHAWRTLCVETLRTARSGLFAVIYCIVMKLDFGEFLLRFASTFTSRA